MTPADAIAHGLTPVTIRAEPGAAGMAARLFPGEKLYMRMSGPPGGPLGAFFWDVDDDARPVEQLIAETLTAWHLEPRLMRQDLGFVVGEDREGVTFKAGEGFGGSGWFAFRIAHVLVAFMVTSRDDQPITAAQVLAALGIARLIATLEIAL